MDITATLSGLTETVEAFEGIAARGTELRPVLQVIADDFRFVEADQFASEGARGSAAWAQLAPSTIRQRGSAHPIEHRTGRLEESLTKPGATGAFQEITGPSLRVGTDVPYATFQQTGTRRMPARPLVDVRPADELRWAETVAKYLTL